MSISFHEEIIKQKEKEKSALLDKVIEVSQKLINAYEEIECLKNRNTIRFRSYENKIKH